MSTDEQKALEEKALEAKQQWWWLAERKRSPRLDYLRKGVWSKGSKGVSYLPGIKVELDRALLYTESYREHENDPLVIRRAKAFAHVWDNIPIFIKDHSQIMGDLGSAPHTVMWRPEHIFVLNEELYNDRTVIPEPEEENRQIVREIANYWGTKTEATKILSIVNPEDVMKMATYFLGWGTPFLSNGYCTKQWDFMFRLGFNGILKEVDKRIAEAHDKLYKGVPDPEDYVYYEKLEFWDAMKIVLEAAIRWANRYSRLAKIIAENFETDPQRKNELLKISQTCKKVPAEPPEHLWESFQFDHFVQIMIRYEAVDTWPGRVDYWHWPYYEKDVIKEKNLTREEVMDLAGEMLIKPYEVGNYIHMQGRSTVQGVPGIYVWTLGGVNEDGSDSCNDLTDIFLEAARLVRVSAPTFAFRYTPNTRVKTLREVFECIRHGLGYPSMRNDPILIANEMHWFGHPLKEARRWVHQACMSPCPDTKWGCQPTRMASATIIAAKAIEYAFTDGYDPVLNMQMGPHTGDAAKFETFEELYQAWHTQITWLMDFYTRLISAGRALDPKIHPRPVLSSLYERCVELGVDALAPIDRGNSWITFFAWMETGDSLAATKKLVFDDKKYTMGELVEALKSNWEGKEEMRMDFVRSPKWGNDDDYVDQIHVRCHNDVAKHSMEIKDPCGGPWPPLPENVAAYVTNASRLGALPNGRRLGDTLYDGGCSPGAGLDKKGPTAVLRSVAKIDHIGSVKSSLLNQRLSPTQLAGEKGFELWHNYIKTWADLGIDHVQFNMVDNETLRAAQKEPEKFTELVVRIAGYSAHFVDMNKKTQDT
ncbi:MAG: pyruvate formate lyase family protein, partial [Thermodesulfobacteriota bacterium]|nr:pyruvate formate lyase family protein [Thermodesulfobacteriota bacterium]